ncbi:E3 SUMO-protein ligase ZBED1-like [Temnothorax longispinosus]|uniref:E3 SUMO-protein ligase ZBED1-like n=1 Tax=Temnothorax longispinosus TaxID=300112 RepID=UPI003A99A160
MYEDEDNDKVTWEFIQEKYNLKVKEWNPAVDVLYRSIDDIDYTPLPTQPHAGNKSPLVFHACDTESVTSCNAVNSHHEVHQVHDISAAGPSSKSNNECSNANVPNRDTTSESSSESTARDEDDPPLKRIKLASKVMIMIFNKPTTFDRSLITSKLRRNEGIFEGTKIRKIKALTDFEETKLRRFVTNFKQLISRLVKWSNARLSFSEGGTRSDKITAALMFMIAKDKEPLSIVNKEGFKVLMKTVAPLYCIPDRKTLTKLMDNRYVEAKECYKSTLEKALSYTLTCDNWTDCTFQSYLGVTIHYLSEDLVMKNGCLGVFPLHTNHTAEYLTECLNSVIDDFKLDKKKIMAITSDGAANIKAAVHNVVGSERHIWCFAHFLSHLVPKILKDMPEINDIIATVKKIVVLIRRSVVATDELKRLQILDGKTEGTVLKFILDVPTRWNSTLYMLERFLALEQYVYAVTLKCKRSDIPDMLTHSQIEVLQEVVSLMKPIEYVIKEISGSKYPTCSTIIPIIHCMTLSIEQVKPSTNNGSSFQKKLLESIQDKFKNVENNMILAVPTILDPRFKRIDFQNARAAAAAVERINKEMKLIGGKKIQEKRSAVQQDKDSNETIWKAHDDMVAKSTDESTEDEHLAHELRQYLKQSVIARHYDPFQHWKSLQNSFPTLYELAIRYISIISTSVPSERKFSEAGDIKSNERNRLTGEHLNRLLFLGSLSKEEWKLE